jgi:hypothetical protein
VDKNPFSRVWIPVLVLVFVQSIISTEPALFVVGRMITTFLIGGLLLFSFYQLMDYVLILKQTVKGLQQQLDVMQEVRSLRELQLFAYMRGAFIYVYQGDFPEYVESLSPAHFLKIAKQRDYTYFVIHGKTLELSFVGKDGTRVVLSENLDIESGTVVPVKYRGDRDKREYTQAHPTLPEYGFTVDHFGVQPIFN